MDGKRSIHFFPNVGITVTGGYITLVAVRCWDDRIFLFDVKLCPKIMYDGGILRLLQSVELLKVWFYRYLLYPDKNELTSLFHDISVSNR